MSALGDRRQAVLEAYFDNDIDEAIETATRVQITPEIIDAAVNSSARGHKISENGYRAIIKAAFEAAGFEVES